MRSMPTQIFVKKQAKRYSHTADESNTPFQKFRNEKINRQDRHTANGTAETFTGEAYPIALNDFILNQEFYSLMIDFYVKPVHLTGRLALKPQGHLFKSSLHKNRHEFIHK